MAENFPHPIPNGWFLVGYEDEIAPGEMKMVHRFGEDLIVFKTGNGEIGVSQPYCPHLGAHLAHGGTVEEDGIRCPFHAWKFAADGTCLEVPYATRIPAQARLQTYRVELRRGLILVWRHSQGKEPFYQVPDLTPLDEGDWSGPVRLHFEIPTQFQEALENTADPAHFRYVHGTTSFPESRWEFDGVEIRSHNEAKMQTPKGEIDGVISAVTFGAGFGWTHYQMGGEMFHTVCTTPVDDRSCVADFDFWVRGLDTDKGLGAAMIREIDRQMHQDIPIWAHKTYHEKPVLCDGDGPIAQVRSWMKQFYSAA